MADIQGTGKPTASPATKTERELEALGLERDEIQAYQSLDMSRY